MKHPGLCEITNELSVLLFYEVMNLTFQFCCFVQPVLLGDFGVSKICIVLRFVRGQFDPTSKVRNKLECYFTLNSSPFSCSKLVLINHV